MTEPHKPEIDIELNDFFEEINCRYNYDFRDYAPTSMRRSVNQAMERLSCTTLAALQTMVINSPDRFYDLIQSLTIPVSEFFRDPSYFLSLRVNVIPLLRTYPSLKVWVAGCSTGEEVYSLAILLQEEGLLERTLIYATDINPRCLKAAARGLFELSDIEAAACRHLEAGGMLPLSDYYVPLGSSARFNNELKRNLVFTDHSLVTDSVFSEVHLISCRNVLIYFNRRLQDRVFGLFHESLCRKCFLGLGAKETIHFSQFVNSFDPFVKSDRVFQKR